MKPLTYIKLKIKRKFKNAKFKEDPADVESGASFLDIEVGDRYFVVDHRPSVGFGISTLENISYGSGPEIVLTEADDVFSYLLNIISKTKT